MNNTEHGEAREPRTKYTFTVLLLKDFPFLSPLSGMFLPAKGQADTVRTSCETKEHSVVVLHGSFLAICEVEELYLTLLFCVYASFG